MSNMSLERLKAIIDAYGAQTARWPETEREAALACLAANPQAQTWVEAARALDDVMEALKVADHGRAEADQPLFEAAVERFAADFMPVGNVIAFPVRSRPAPVSRPVLWSVGIAAAACVAGAALGINLSLMSLSDLRVTSVLEQVAMIDGGD